MLLRMLLALSLYTNLHARPTAFCNLPLFEALRPLNELIASGEAVFNLIRISEMDIHAKNAFFQLEKQFGFYARLVQEG